MKEIGIVFSKELTRVFKDKKLVFSLFILPVVLIIGMYTLIGTLITNTNKDIEEHNSIVFIQNAPEDFKKFQESLGVNDQVDYIYKDAEVDSIKNGILEGTVDLLIVFEDGFIDRIAEYETENVTPQIKTYYNPSEEYSSAARTNYVTGILEAYRQQLLADRIEDLNSITIFTIDSDNAEMEIQDEEKATGKMLGMLLPYFITLMLFAGAMSLGVDSITGEKERGTMASMLITPVKRSFVVLGKIFALMVLSGLSAASYVIAMVIAFPLMIKSFAGGAEVAGISVNFTLIQILELAIIMITLVFLYVAIIGLVAVFAKTTKEGGTYITPIYIIVIAAGMITMYGTSKAEVIHYCIPLYNSSLALKELFSRELSFGNFLLTAITTLAAGAILTSIIVKAFNSEKVMFNA